MEKIKNFDETFDKQIEKNIKDYRFTFKENTVINKEKIEDYKFNSKLFFLNELIKHIQNDNSIKSYEYKNSRTIDKRTFGEYYADIIFKGWVCEDFFVMNMKKFGVRVELNGSDKERQFTNRPTTVADFKINFKNYEYQVSGNISIFLKEDKLKGLLKTNSNLLSKTKTGYIVISANQIKRHIEENKIKKEKLYGSKDGWKINFDKLTRYTYKNEMELKKEFQKKKINIF